MSIAQLMHLKLYLNKFLKTDNIEHYTLRTLEELKKSYDDLLESSEGYDPDFPMSGVGGGKGKNGMKTMKIKGNNVYSMYDENNPDPNFKGIERSALAKAKSKPKELD